MLEPLPQLAAVRFGVCERLTVSWEAEDRAAGPLLAVFAQRVGQLAKVVRACDDIVWQ